MQDQTFVTDVGKKIRQARQESQMTQEMLAQKVGVSRVTINQLENGHRKQIKPVLIQHIADAMATSVEYFYSTPSTRQNASQNQPQRSDGDLPSELDATLSRIRTFSWQDQERLGEIIGKLVNWYAEQKAS